MGSVSRPTNFVVIGAGSRGSAYARAVTTVTSGTIAAVAEPDAFKRREFGRKYIWGAAAPTPYQQFSDWKEWIAYETDRRVRLERALDGKNGVYDSRKEVVVTGVFICTLDDTHAEIIRALAPLELHILCEKPLALNMADCLSILGSVSPGRIFSIGHVLRYSPHNMLLRKLLYKDRVIGDVFSMEHTEPIGWWHFAHSYVRGNWRRGTPEGVGSLLTKSCHDIDFIMWLLCSPPDPVYPSDTPEEGTSATNASEDTQSILSPPEPPHLPATITSSGSLTHFNQSSKPALAGTSTNCLSCPAASTCNFSATKIYRDRWLRKERDTGWPLKILVPEIEDLVVTRGWEAAEARLMEKLGEDYDAKVMPDKEVAERGWYGRCVYESDNDVVSDQTVTISWDADPSPSSTSTSSSHPHHRGPKTALFHMTYPTQSQCSRRGRIYGTHGEISYDSTTITVYLFSTDSTTSHTLPRQSPEEEKAHGGGDFGLARAFVQAVQAVEAEEMEAAEAQRLYVGCDLEEVVRSHAMVFAAEDARRGRKVVEWQGWWEAEVAKWKLGKGEGGG